MYVSVICGIEHPSRCFRGRKSGGGRREAGASQHESGFCVQDRLGKLIAIRHPMGGNDDCSMNVGNDLAEKICVIRMEATEDELVHSPGEVLRTLRSRIPGTPKALHLVRCGGRRVGIGDRIGEVAREIREAAGDVPFLVGFTFGEYGFERDGQNACGGLMLSLALTA